jgi:hypothetical protein
VLGAKIPSALPRRPLALKPGGAPYGTSVPPAAVAGSSAKHRQPRVTTRFFGSQNPAMVMRRRPAAWITDRAGH